MHAPSRNFAPLLLLCTSALLSCLPCGAQDAAPTGLQEAVAAADDAARTFDFQGALKQLEAAIPNADPDTAAQLKQRASLYERYLGMPSLVELAQNNPGELVGQGATRGGTQLSGLVRLVELGIVPGARFGNRVRRLGRLELATPDGSVTVQADQIAQLSLTWAEPAEGASARAWTLQEVTVLLRDGSVVKGGPTWSLCVSVFGVRGKGDEEDTMIETYPAFGREFNPDDLLTEVLLVGGPPQETPEPAAADDDTSPAADGTPPATDENEGNAP